MTKTKDDINTRLWAGSYYNDEEWNKMWMPIKVTKATETAAPTQPTREDYYNNANMTTEKQRFMFGLNKKINKL